MFVPPIKRAILMESIGGSLLLRSSKLIRHPSRLYMAVWIIAGLT